MILTLTVQYPHAAHGLGGTALQKPIDSMFYGKGKYQARKTNSLTKQPLFRIIRLNTALPFQLLPVLVPTHVFFRRDLKAHQGAETTPILRASPLGRGVLTSGIDSMGTAD
jgi:hypothetical protein